MYLQHFGLERNPYSLTPDPRFLFFTAKHREALAALLFGVTERKGLIVMTGEAGTGKTTLIRKLLSSCPEDSVQFSVIINPALTGPELLESILMDFGLKDLPSSKAARLARFKDLLVAAHKHQRIVVLVIDEAHLLGSDLIEEIRLLSNFETCEQKLLQIVLAGQKELNRNLNLPSMTQVKQRVAIRMQLDPLSPTDVEPYIRTRWAKAGRQAPLPFRPESIQVISSFSGGIPRLINVMCDAALVNAYGTGKKEIRSEDIAEVIADLQLLPGERTETVPHLASTPISSSLPNSSDIVDRAPVGIGPINRYVPPMAKRRRLLRVGTWFRLAQTGVK